MHKHSKNNRSPYDSGSFLGVLNFMVPFVTLSYVYIKHAFKIERKLWYVNAKLFDISLYIYNQMFGHQVSVGLRLLGSDNYLFKSLGIVKKNGKL